MFEAGDDVLVRAAALPLSAAQLTDAFGDDVSRVPVEVVTDGRLREALLVASPSLASDLAAVLDGVDLPAKRVRRVARSVARYLLRMSGRSTPFGELAGVAVGNFGENSRGELGQCWRKSVQPDRDWLVGVVRAHEDTGLAAIGQRVVLNNLVRVRPNRVVVSRLRDDGRRVSRSVRRTAVVDAICTLAGTPLSLERLRELLKQRFPAAPDAALLAMLRQLISIRVLLTDNHPAPDNSDPLRHVAARFPTSALLQSAMPLFDEFERRPVGGGYDQLSALHRHVDSAQATNVTLVFDADVRLPPIVAREAERAAEVLWRLSDPEPRRVRSLRAYHREFLERYSLGELVPVVALLDAETGLGPPAGYRMPAGHRPVPVDPPADEQRHSVMHRLVAESLLSGQRYVDLDDQRLAVLEYDGGEPSSSMLLRASVIASTLHDLEKGNFTLAISPVAASGLAGSLWGRFAQALGAEGTLREMVSRTFRHEQAIPVQVVYAAEYDRGGNILAAPILADHRLPIGIFVDPDEPGHVDLANVVVSADEEAFHIFDAATGRELMPFVPHHHRGELAPNVVRFLVEAPRMGVRHVRSFSWGPLRGAPFLPGLRYGRAVLRSPTWSLHNDDISGVQDSDVTDWMRRLRVPDHVRLAEDDRHISLDLSKRGHRLLLRDELSRTGSCTLFEDPHQGSTESWLRSTDGAHDSELMIPLFSRPQPRRPGVFTALREPGQLESGLPGGLWLSARLYVPAEAQRELLTAAVSPWVRQMADVVDRWFFVRYADHDSHNPHLRLRLRRRPDAVEDAVLAAFHAWARSVTDAGLVSDVTLAPYRPEVERYGGTTLLPLVESVFHTDSLFVLDRLTGKDDLVRVAADVAVLIGTFWEFGGVDGRSWILQAYPKDEERHRSFRERRRELMDAVGRSRSEPSGQPESDWTTSLKAYAIAVHEAAQHQAWIDPGRILRAVVHMHCNRRLRLGADDELTVYAMLRGAVQAIADRVRAIR